MSSTRAALKAAKTALDGHRYNDAVEHANIVLNADSNNYHAYVDAHEYLVPQ